MAGHVFISYAREDSAYVTRLVSFLARAGVQVWLDDDIATGDRWERVLTEKIEACAALLVVMSPAAAGSAWVAREVGYARQHGKPVLPLLLGGLVIFGLDDVQVEDVTDGAMPRSGLVLRLRGMAPQRAVVRHLVGVVPDAADSYQHRELADRLDAALETSGTAILTGAQPQILSGLGGVGKTQLAAAVARRLRDRGDLHLLVWVSAASADSIIAGYAQAGAEVAGADRTDPPTAAKALMQWLAATTSCWLVVLDDLADSGDLDGWWPPRTPTGRVVVTTRRRDAALATHGALVEVNVVTPTEAHAYLAAKFADHPSRLVEADDLARDLGFLPMALAQAAAYISDRNLTCARLPGPVRRPAAPLGRAGPRRAAR